VTALVAQPQRTRHAGYRQQTLATAQQRLMILMLIFAGVAVLIVGRIGWLAFSADGSKMDTAKYGQVPYRGDIVDRNGEILARTIEAWSIGIHPKKILNNPVDLSQKLAQLMPERTAEQYLEIMKSGVNFTYLRRRALPDLVAQVNALGEPGIAYDREPERLYPQITLGAHVLGYTDMDGHGVMGMERVLEEQLDDPVKRNKPAHLSIDGRVQAAMESELADAMTKFQAIGATGLVLDVHSGEIIAMASLPVYNPNKISQADPEALRNNVTQSVYELGSTFKPLTIAQAIESGVVKNLARRYDATTPLKVGPYTIKDDHPTGRWLNAPEAMVHSSNIVTARIADELGKDRMEGMFKKLGFYDPPYIELREKGRPLKPPYWGRTTTMTVAYGHGIAVTPLHLASAYATLVNGGIWRPATLMKVEPGKAAKGERVFSQQTSDTMRHILRMIVTDGTGKSADALGLRVGGKTGTAEKPSEGGYNKHVNVTTFAAAFPMDAPRYVILTMMDSPKGGVTTAAYTAAPVVGKVVSRIGPMLGIYPDQSVESVPGSFYGMLWKAKGAP
jgi:cell division protein FtsI (penicillin-binding protein 3)